MIIKIYTEFWFGIYNGEKKLENEVGHNEWQTWSFKTTPPVSPAKEL